MARAFPKYQFILATHSPFVITSIPTSNAYTLDLLNRYKCRTFEHEDFHSGFKNASAMAVSVGV